MSNSYKLWNDREIQILKNLSSTNKISYRDIGKILNRPLASCQSKASQLGLKNEYNKIAGKKYTVDENFWEIPNETNCYWAGFSAADANVSEHRLNHFTYRLEIQRSDEQHLYELKKVSNYSGTIKQYSRPLRNSFTSAIKVNSDKWAHDLKNNFGIIPKKTNIIMPPNLNDSLLLRWIIGYTDGDGCIYFINKQPYLKYVSCNKILIEWIKNYFDNFGNKLRNKNSKITNENNKYHIFSIGGLKAAQFIDKVNKLDCYKLERKWSNVKILEIISDYKLKYPQFFIEKTS